MRVHRMRAVNHIPTSQLSTLSQNHGLGTLSQIRRSNGGQNGGNSNDGRMTILAKFHFGRNRFKVRMKVGISRFGVVVGFGSRIGDGVGVEVELGKRIGII